MLAGMLFGCYLDVIGVLSEFIIAFRITSGHPTAFNLERSRYRCHPLAVAAPLSSFVTVISPPITILCRSLLFKPRVRFAAVV